MKEFRQVEGLQCCYLEGNSRGESWMNASLDKVCEWDGADWLTE